MQMLSRLLGKETDYFERTIAKLEAAIDRPAIDVEVIGEIAAKAARLKCQLRLDPSDTTAEELYQVLLQTLRNDNTNAARVLGGMHANAVSEMTPLIVAWLNKRYRQQECLAVKPPVLKRLIRNNPPHAVMKALHYRSIDSMIKHEAAEHIVVLARYFESSEWNTRHADLLESLTPGDMVSRTIMIVHLDKDVLVRTPVPSESRHHLVIHAREAGIVAVVPPSAGVIECYTLRTVSLMMYYIQETIYLTTLARVFLTQPDFARRYTSALIRDHDNHYSIAGYPVHWRSLHHAIAESFSGIEIAPHIEPGQWRYDSVNALVDDLLPAQSIWRNLGPVIVPLEPYISTNIIDLAIDASPGKTRAAQSLKYARRELEHELMRRYLGHPSMQHVAMKRLRIL